MGSSWSTGGGFRIWPDQQLPVFWPSHTEDQVDISAPYRPIRSVEYEYGAQTKKVGKVAVTWRRSEIGHWGPLTKRWRCYCCPATGM